MSGAPQSADVAEMHTPYSSLKRLLSVLNGFIAIKCPTFGIIHQWGTLLFVPEVALEHNFMTLRKVRGYSEPADYPTDWNLVMEELKCCGVRSYTDVSGSSFEVMTGHTYPRSHCRSIGTVACSGHRVSTDVIYSRFEVRLPKITKTQGFSLSGGSLGVAMIQVRGILATLQLFIKLG
ncbi:tetraspanin-16 [Manis pentadactyla]|uniref:tetraspanin-16 n=1 Tax=Manis pentadactyla TaxID=143292 RepID=UPI00255C880C|nr:tetraspanin-16 [Manis pentadactyla]